MVKKGATGENFQNFTKIFKILAQIWLNEPYRIDSELTPPGSELPPPDGLTPPVNGQFFYPPRFMKISWKSLFLEHFHKLLK